MIGWVAAGAGVLPAGSQDRPQAALHHNVSVTLKLIQIYVVDKEGKPVTDLAKSDFELWDDGKLKPLTEFEIHTLSLGTAPKAVPPEGLALPAPTLNRKIFFFFDFAFNTTAGIKESRKAALHFVDTQVLPDDEIGIISYHARNGLAINAYLTTDHKKIRDAIETVKPSARMGRAADVGDDSLQELAATLTSVGADAGAATLLAAEERLQEQHTTAFILRMTDLAKAIRYIPGVKSIVLYSAGIANFILYGSERSENDESSFSSRTGNPRIRAAFQNMCETLAASNSSIYPINVKGLGRNYRKSTERDLLGDSSLHALANESGGKYFDNVLNYQEIGAEIQSLTGAYYVLGYYIGEKWDGEYHKIKVRVRRKDCEVHGQGGYFNPKPFTEYSESEKTLHLIDLALSEKPHLQEAVDFPVRAQACGVGDKNNVAVLADIPVRWLAEVLGNKFEFIAIAFDDKNNIAAIRRKELSVEQPPSGSAFAKSILSLPPGEFECRVVLRNMITGKGARGSSRIMIPDRSEINPLSFLQPLLLAPLKDQICLEEENPRKELRLWEIYPFDPNAYAPLMNASLQPAFGIKAIIPCLAPPSDLDAVSFSASAVSLSSGERTEIPISMVKWTGKGMRCIVSLNLDTATLKSGEYALYITADVPNAGRRMISAGPIKAY